MKDVVCILTVGDFETLHALKKQWSSQGHALLPVLRGKLDGAQIVFPADLPRDVATLGSCIAYTIADGPVQVHKLTTLAGIDGRWLSVNQPIGLALLGAREGQNIDVAATSEITRGVRLHRVLDQPETNWPGRFQSGSVQPDGSAQPGERNAQWQSASARHDQPGSEDDPGPAAA